MKILLRIFDKNLKDLKDLCRFFSNLDRSSKICYKIMLILKNLQECTKILKRFSPGWGSMEKECVVPENVHTPPQKGLKIPGGGGIYKAKKL